MKIIRDVDIAAKRSLPSPPNRSSLDALIHQLSTASADFESDSVRFGDDDDGSTWHHVWSGKDEECLEKLNAEVYIGVYAHIGVSGVVGECRGGDGGGEENGEETATLGAQTAV